MNKEELLGRVLPAIHETATARTFSKGKWLEPEELAAEVAYCLHPNQVADAIKLQLACWLLSRNEQGGAMLLRAMLADPLIGPVTKGVYEGVLSAVAKERA